MRSQRAGFRFQKRFGWRSFNDAPALLDLWFENLCRSVEADPLPHHLRAGMEDCTIYTACMKGFITERTLMPETCPEGHPREPADDFGSVPAETVATE